jgi:hypothetical protein
MDIYKSFDTFYNALTLYLKSQGPKLDNRYMTKTIDQYQLQNLPILYMEYIRFIILSLCDQYLSKKFGDKETTKFNEFLVDTKFDVNIRVLYSNCHYVTGWKNHSVSVIKQEKKYILCNSHVGSVYGTTILNQNNPICIVHPKITSEDQIIYNFDNKKKAEFFRESNFFPNIIMDKDGTYLYIYGDIEEITPFLTLFKTFNNTVIPNKNIILHIYDKQQQKLFEYSFGEELDMLTDFQVKRALGEIQNSKVFFDHFPQYVDDPIFALNLGEHHVNLKVKDITYKIVRRNSSWEDGKETHLFLHDLEDGTFEYPCNVKNLQAGGSCTVFSKFYAFLYLYITEKNIPPEDHHNTQITILHQLQEWSFQYLTFYSQLYIDHSKLYERKETTPLMDIAFYIAISTGLVKIRGEINVFYDERETIKNKWKAIFGRIKHNQTDIPIQTNESAKTSTSTLIDQIRSIYGQYSLPELYYLSCIPHNEFHDITYGKLEYNKPEDILENILEINSFFALSVYHRLILRNNMHLFDVEPLKKLGNLKLPNIDFPIQSICAYQTTQEAMSNSKSYFCAQLFPTVFQFNKNTITPGMTFDVEFRNIPMELPNRDKICNNLLKFHLTCLFMKTKNEKTGWSKSRHTIDEIEIPLHGRTGVTNEFKDCLSSRIYQINYFLPSTYKMPPKIKGLLQAMHLYYNDHNHAFKRCKWYDVMTKDYEIPLEMRLQLNVYFNRPLTDGMNVDNLYCSGNVAYILGIQKANLMDDDVKIDISSRKKSYIEWAIYMHIHHYDVDPNMLNRLQKLLEILNESKLLTYYRMVDEKFDPILNYNLPILIYEGNLKKTETGANLLNVQDSFMTFWHDKFKTKEFVFLKIQCINRSGHFLHLMQHEEKWYMDLEHKIQVHTTDIPKLNSHEFSWGMKIHPVTNDTSKVISYLVIQKNKHTIFQKNMEPVYCGELKIQYVPQETEYVYTYINVQGEALLCDTKNDLELITMCAIENKRHDVYARLYPQLYCFPDVNKKLLNPVNSNFPFAKMQNSIQTLDLERNGYGDWDSPVMFLYNHFLPPNLQITQTNGYDFSTYKDIIEYGLQRKMDMRPEQIQLLNDIIYTNFQYTFVQRIMGAGKTSVILPFLALYYMYQHILKGNTPLETYTLMIVPYPQLIEQVFRRFLHAMGWTGVVQIQIRTEMEKIDCPYKFETRRVHIPLVIVCTDAWVKYQMIMNTFKEITNRPVFVSMDEYDEIINPYRSRFILYEDLYHGKKLNDVFSSSLLKMNIKVFDMYMQGRYNETDCVKQITQFQSSNQFVQAAWYLAVREIFNYTYLLHFGLHPDKLFAVPYIAQGLFSKNEEFEDPMFRVIATLYSILRDGTNSSQNKQYFQYLKENKYKKEHVPISWRQLYTTKQLSLDKIYTVLRPLKSVDDIYPFTEHILFKRIQLNGTMFSCATPHMFSHIKQGIMSAQTKVIGMTGTLRPEDIPSKVFPERNVILDNEWTQVIQLLDQSTHINLTENTCTMKSYLNKMNETIQQRSFLRYRHHAYIDVGATNLTYKPDAVGNVEKTIRHIIENELKDQNYTHVIYPGKGNEPYIFECETKTSMRYNDRMPGTNEKWLYYFDHPHCRGYDVKTIFDNIIVPILGFVMVSADNMLNEVAQAAFRLRHLLDIRRTQRLVLIYPRQISRMVHLTTKQNEQYVSRVTLLTEQIEKSEKDNENDMYIKKETKNAWFIHRSFEACRTEIQSRLGKNMKTAVLERSVRSELHMEVKQEVNINVEQEITNNYSRITRFRFFVIPDQISFYVITDFTDISMSIYMKQIEHYYIECINLFFIPPDSIVLCPHMYEFELNLILERYDVFFKEIVNASNVEFKYVCLYAIVLVILKLYNINMYPLLINTSLVFENKKIIQIILNIPESEDLSIPQILDANYLPIENDLKTMYGEMYRKENCTAFKNLIIYANVLS